MKTKCTKCNYESESNRKRQLNGDSCQLCQICWVFAPENEKELLEYINEKIQSESLDSFRKYYKSRSEKLKKGMIGKAEEGKSMSRPPFGYLYENKKLVPAQNFREVEEIFEEFLNSNISLRQLAEKHSFSVNGLKKILKNFTYLGKIKFDGVVHQGNHQPIISSTLFNHVQNKLKELK